VTLLSIDALASSTRMIRTPLCGTGVVGGDGHGNYPTLKEAQHAALYEAETVAKAINNTLERIACT
jgi:hypothetical protein